MPYYLFVERDTGARRYFEVPLARALAVYREAIQMVSGLARTVRGPSIRITSYNVCYTKLLRRRARTMASPTSCISTNWFTCTPPSTACQLARSSFRVSGPRVENMSSPPGRSTRRNNFV